LRVSGNHKYNEKESINSEVSTFVGNPPAKKNINKAEGVPELA